MRYPILLLSLTISLLACKHIAEDHLPRATMQKVLTDIHLAEVYSTMVPKDSTRHSIEKNMDSLSLYYKEIFAHYNINEEQFQQSMKWYRQHPDELDSIYVRMLPAMDKLQ